MSSPPTTRTRAGLGLAALLGLFDVVLTFFPAPEGEIGPPLWIVILSGLCGVVTLVAVVLAWRTGQRSALWTIVGTRVLSALTGVPAFFVGAPTVVVVLVAVFILLTIVCVALVVPRAGRTASVTD